MFSRSCARPNPIVMAAFVRRSDNTHSFGYQSMVLKSLVLLSLLVFPCDAVRRDSTLNLASMRINTAKLQLQESSRAASMLDLNCHAELEAARGNLEESNRKVLKEPDEARRELVKVSKFLQSCSQNLSSSENSQAYNLLTRVGQSVASAENLIDESEITEMASPTQDIVNDEGNEQELISESNNNHSGDEWASLLASRVEDGNRQLQKHPGPLMSTLVPVPPKIDISMDELIVDFCPNHIDLTKSAAAIRLDRACGGKFHTRAKYSSGVFTMRMRPPSQATGVSNSLYISSDDGAPDMISFDFIGNEPRRVRTSYAVEGDHDFKLKTFHMDFDTTQEFHEYTIKWDAEAIVWMIDEVVIRTLRASAVKAYPTKPGHVYGYSWDASSVANGTMAGRVDWYNAPFFMGYENFQVTSPLRVGQWQPQQQKIVMKGDASPVRPLVIDYCPANIIAEDDYGYEIAFDDLGCGGRVRSLHTYPSGTFSARIKCAEGDTSGLLTSFYISSGEGSTMQDEIDFEFLGNNKTIVQTNFYVNGTSTNEVWVMLDYDCSHEFHTYTMKYDQERIQWFVDNRLVRTVLKEDPQISPQRKPYPTKKMYLYSSLWNASDINHGIWTGKWHGMAEEPFVAKFKDVIAQFP